MCGLSLSSFSLASYCGCRFFRGAWSDRVIFFFLRCFAVSCGLLLFTGSGVVVVSVVVSVVYCSLRPRKTYLARRKELARNLDVVLDVYRSRRSAMYYYIDSVTTHTRTQGKTFLEEQQ